MADADRPFVITVRRRWLLLLLPILALLYFAAVVTLNVLDYRIQGVTNQMLALGGLGLFVVVILIELPFFFRRSAPRAPRPRAEPAGAGAPASPAGPRVAWNDELLITQESQQGLRVLEYSNPAKRQNPSAVYTKTYVPVSAAHVLRIETLVAEPTDL